MVSFCSASLINFPSSHVLKGVCTDTLKEVAFEYSIKLSRDSFGHYVRRELMHLYVVVVSCHVENATVVFNEASVWCIIGFNRWSVQRKDATSGCVCVFDACVFVPQHFDLFSALPDLSTHSQHLGSASAGQWGRHHHRCPLLSSWYSAGISTVFYGKATSHRVHGVNRDFVLLYICYFFKCVSHCVFYLLSINHKLL